MVIIRMLFILILLLLIIPIAYAEAPVIEWNITFGGSGRDSANSVQQTSDGGYIVVGTTNSSDSGNPDVWLVKIYPNGSMQWNKTFDGDFVDTGNSVQQTSDGGYVIAGDIGKGGVITSARNSNVWLVKTDPNGVMQWNRTFAGRETNNIYSDRANSVQQTSDGGYIIAGSTLGNTTGCCPPDIWLIKTDSNGTMQWNQTFGETNWEAASSVQQTTDNGYIIAGFKRFGSNENFWLIKTDSNGTMQWNQTFVDSYEDFARSVQQTSDGGYIVVGEKGKSYINYSDFWMIKLDSNGNEQWNKTFGGTGIDEAYSVQQTLDNGYIIAGYTDSSGAGAFDFWLIKTDSNGTMQWNQTLGGIDNDIATSVKTTTGEGYIIAGNTSSFGAGLDDMWIIKLKGINTTTPINLNINITSVNLTNSDDLNRTNGTLQASWSFNVSNSSINAIETLWYVNNNLIKIYTNRTFINPENTTKYENWTFSIRILNGSDWTNFVNSSTVTINNNVPILNIILNIIVNETDLVDINLTGNVSATDLDGDNIIYTYSVPLNSSGKWQTGYKDARNYTVTVTADDGNRGIATQNVLITVLDKVNGASDTIIGNLSDVKTNVINLDLMINNTEFNPRLNFTGTNRINFTENNNTIVEFDYDFSNLTKFSFVDIKINKTFFSGSGSIVIKGIDLSTQGRTKIVYMNRTNTTYNSVCIKDAEISSVDQLSNDCSASDETKLSCDGSSASGYTCTLQDMIYKITGLSHSGIKQISYTPSSGGSSGGGGGGGDSGGGGGGGGTAGFVCNMDWKCSEWSGCINSFQTRQCDFVKVPQHVQDTECPQESKIPITSQACKINNAVSNPIKTNEFKQQATKPQAVNESKKSEITGLAVQEVKGNSKTFIAIIGISAIAFLGGLFYFRFFKPKT